MKLTAFVAIVLVMVGTGCNLDGVSPEASDQDTRLVNVVWHTAVPVFFDEE